MHRLPSGLPTGVTKNGDPIASFTHDTAGRLASLTRGPRQSTSFSRDAAGKVESSTTIAHLLSGSTFETFTHTCLYDALGRRVSASDSGGNTVSSKFDSLGRVTQSTDERGVVHHFRYDGELPGGPGAPPQPFSSLHECDADNDGDLEVLSYGLYFGQEELSCTNSNSYTTTCTCDSAGNLTQCDFPDGTLETYGFDNCGRPNRITHKDGTITGADLDLDGRCDLLTVTGNPVAVPVDPVDYRYNGLGQCTGMDQGASHLVFTWDSLGNQLSEHHNGLGVTRTFEQRGCTGITYSDGTRFVETRDEFGLFLSKSAVSSTGQVLSPPVTVMEYTCLLLTCETRANGVVTKHDYRSDGEPPLADTVEDFSFGECVSTVCRDASNNVIHSTRISRDRSQNVTQHDTLFAGGAQPPGRRHIQSFDRLDRLTQSIIQRREVTDGPFVQEHLVTYTLDLEGRRLSESGGITLGLYTQNPLLPPGDHQMGRYSSWPGGPGGSSSPLLWDDEGCLTTMSGGTGSKQFLYDARSRLVAVNDAATRQPIATCAYDAAGRRTRSTIASSDPLIPPVDTFFVYDGTDCIQELGGDGLPNITVATEAGIGLCIISRNGTYVYPHGGGPKDTGAAMRTNPPIVTKDVADIAETGSGYRLKVWQLMQGQTGAQAMRWTPLVPKPRDPVTYRWTPVVPKPQPELFASSAGVPTERADCDDAGAPIFLTSDGVLRAGATGTLSGYDWFHGPRGFVVNSHSGARYCPETGFLQFHGSVYSPQLGTTVAKEKKKEKPKDEPVRYDPGIMWP